MRRFGTFALAVASVAAAAAMVLTAGAAATRGAGPPNDFVLASLTDQYGEHYAVTAWSGPDGEKPRGSVQVTPFLAGFTFDVVCLAVHRHEALVVTFSRVLRAEIILTLRDNRDGPDELLAVDYWRAWPDTCPQFDGAPGMPGVPITGDINIHDA